MKAVVQNAVGAPADVLKLTDIEDQGPLSRGEVLISVELSPVHHGDLQLIRSQQSIPVDSGYVRRGSEAVGIVRALGTDLEGQGNLKIGDRVIAFPTTGSWAESIVISASSAIPVPPEISNEVAAQLLINYVTARTILRELRKSAPDEALRNGAVLVTGASTVVARILLYLLVNEGLAPIGLARSTTSANRVATELAGVQVAATENTKWQTQITSLAGGNKIVAVLDCVSGLLLGDIAPILADGATIVTYGALGGDYLSIGASEVVVRQFVIRGVTFGRWFVELSHEEQMNDIHAAFKLAVELPSLFKVSRIFGLAELQEAISAVEAPNRDGFVFIRP